MREELSMTEEELSMTEELSTREEENMGTGHTHISIYICIEPDPESSPKRSRSDSKVVQTKNRTLNLLTIL